MIFSVRRPQYFISQRLLATQHHPLVRKSVYITRSQRELGRPASTPQRRGVRMCAAFGARGPELDPGGITPLFQPPHFAV